MPVHIEYMTVEEAAKIWKVTPERILYTCENFGIEGFAKLGDKWIIPKDMCRPKIKMIPSTKPVAKLPKNGRTYIKQAFIDSFNGNAIPMSVDEFTVGRGTVTCISKSAEGANRTFMEVICRMAFRDMEFDPSIDWSLIDTTEALKKLREFQLARQPTLEQVLEEKHKMLVNMGFSENDIEMLMEKYTEYYASLK